MYFLLDANIVAGYYLPRSLNGKKAATRIEYILNHIRSSGVHFLYIPNFCIAETISVFVKHSFGSWNRQVKKQVKGGRVLDKRVYEKLVRSFANDIHNGRFIYHYELNRYHILGINLVAPIDHYYKISRGNSNNARPAGTFDHLIISMGIHLAHIHGRENVCILTADRRLCQILDKCKSNIGAGTIDKLKLKIAEDVCGKPFSAELFPDHLDLERCKDKDLKRVFGEWPVKYCKKDVRNIYRWKD